MGTGIEARFARCRSYWSKHLEYSRAFQSRHATGGGHAMVLGAGRLLDVPGEELCTRYTTLTLWDADPTACGHWQVLRKGVGRAEVKERLADCTGVLQRWSEELSALVRGQPQNSAHLARFLAGLRVESNEAPVLGPVDTAISTNLLSQIPIYWRDRVHTIVEKGWGLSTDPQGEYDAAVQGALITSMKTLQSAHLEALAGSGAALIVLVYDAFFAFYRKDIAPWQIEPSVFVESVAIPGYSPIEEDTWLWHIAPQGIEQDEYGSIHKVVARAFKKI